MNVAKFQERDCFALLDLEARFCFKTDTSVSFQVGRRRSPSSFSVRGWLDIHHPVHTEYGTKAYVRVALPLKYLELEQMKRAVASVLEALEIPAGEVYEAHFFTPENHQCLFVEEPGVWYTCAS